MMTKVLNTKHLLTAAVTAFFMLLTRGGHTLTPLNLPDASVVLFLLGGLYLGSDLKISTTWFAAFFILATIIDFGAAAIDPAQGFCLTNGYWGLIPAYGVMWLGGRYLAKTTDAFATKNLIVYSLVSVITSFVAFVISTQTYYLFSGRFPAQGLIESLKHGWEYLPSWIGFSAMYFAIIWLSVALWRSVKPAQKAPLQTSKV